MTTVLKETGAFFHSIADFAASAPSNVWAMCAFTAAASIMVTLVTLVLWPKERSAKPDRETMDPCGVRQLAMDGMRVPEIARRTGLSHDAVATILRARSRPRGGDAASPRQSHPTAA
jgi:hypothetical protein